MVKLIELGPFGCRIVRGEVEDINCVPKDLTVCGIDETQGTTVYVEQASKEGGSPS